MECDLRNPSIHTIFKISNINGLTDILTGKKNFSGYINSTEINNLRILICGQMPINHSEMLSSNKIKDFINRLRQHYDYIFVDAP